MIDNIDYSILKCMEITDTAIWKKRVHTLLREYHTILPVPEQISLQTVSRHIDQMHNQQLLSSSIINPDGVSRSMIIGYRITGRGRNVMNSKRKDLLKCIVGRELFSAKNQLHIDKNALAEMINDEFGLHGYTEKTVNHYSRKELLILLGFYFMAQDATDVFGEKERQKYREIIREQKEISAAFSG